MAPQVPQRILIRSPNWLGDALMITPVLHTLRRDRPEASLTVLAHPWVEGLFTENPDVDEVISYRKPGPHQGLWGEWRLSRQLKIKGFEAAVLFPHSFESAWITFLSRIPQRIGYATEGRGLFLTHRLKRTSVLPGEHQVASFFRLLGPLGVEEHPDPLTHPLRLHLPSREIQRAAERLKGLGVSDQETLVGLAPGARYGSAKCWPLERFEGLAERLVKKGSVKVVLLGTEQDALAGKKEADRLGAGVYDLSGQTDLIEALALIRRCRLFVSNDSGLMHAAAALQVPLIALFGPTDPARTGPWGGRHRVIRKVFPCWPCRRQHCERRPNCMEDISLQEVLDAALDFLSEETRQ